MALKAGMTLSNEPGYYEDGRFGIRIENVCIVKNAKTLYQIDERGYLAFEHFTMCPIQTKLVDAKLLTQAEREWLNNYHAEVLAKVRPLLIQFKDERAINWLERECSPI